MHQIAEAEGKVSGRTAFDAMRKGDIAGIKVVDQYIKYVACGLINLVNALQPEIICIGGGICNELKDILYIVKFRLKLLKQSLEMMQALSVLPF